MSVLLTCSFRAYCEWCDIYKVEYEPQLLIVSRFYNHLIKLIFIRIEDIELNESNELEILCILFGEHLACSLRRGPLEF